MADELVNTGKGKKVKHNPGVHLYSRGMNYLDHLQERCHEIVISRIITTPK